MSTTIETLREQHRAVLAHLDEIEAGTPASIATLEDFLGFLQTEVRKHFGLEEDALFPVLARHPHLAQGPIAVMDAEHHEFRALVAQLALALRTGDADRPTTVAQMIITLLRAHIDKEDHVLFPLATHVLTAAELDEVEARAAVCRHGSGPEPETERCKR